MTSRADDLELLLKGTLSGLVHEMRLYTGITRVMLAPEIDGLGGCFPTKGAFDLTHL